MGREADITETLYRSILELNLMSLKRVLKGRAVTTRDFKDTIIKWYGHKLPWPLVEPDLILAFEDLDRRLDDVMLVAIEVKYFGPTADLQKRLRQCFREFGQPLRNLIFGFDSVVLWHMFSPSVDQERIQSYTAVVAESIERLKLPVVYLASTVLDSGLQIHKPFDIPRQELESTIMWLQNLCRDRRNPSMDKEVEMRRKSLKVTLRIPT